MRKFDGKDNYGKLKSDYVKLVLAMTDDELFKETKRKIWLSAYAANNGRSDFHWHVDACYDAWGDRGKQDEYGRAYKVVEASC